MNFWMSDIGYWIKVYSDIRYNVGLRSLQSDIGSSDIKLSPISLITDIGVSAHLCFCGLFQLLQYVFCFYESSPSQLLPFLVVIMLAM
jgi:hypothetical protein